MPALLSPKLHYPDGRDRSHFESLDDLGDLEIVQEMVGYLFVDISAYTKLKLIYRLNMDYTPERVTRLCEYLQQNCQPGKRCELWVIDLSAELWEDIHAELAHLHRSEATLETLTPELLAKEYDRNAPLPRVLAIQ